MIKEEMGPVPGTIALFGCFLIMIIILAVLALIVVKALAESPWGVFTVCSTVPIALFMGIYMRFIRPGRVGEVSVIGIVLLVASIYFGGVIAHDPYWGPALTFKDTTITFALIGYAFVSALLPVWLILAPRDYLATFLKIGVIVGLALGIVVLNPELKMPAMTQYIDGTGPLWKGALFPFLFITIACGAISGFHSLVASGTTSKQLDREAEAQPIAYGGMLLECLVAVISLCAVAFVFSGYMDGTYASPTQVFAAGLSQMLACVPGLAGAESVAYALLVLAVSVFCLTSLDTATRLGRYMFQELFTPHGMEASDLTGWRAVLVNPWVATIITVVLGVGLGMTGYQLVWPLFGAANQLLAALGLLAVCAWLGNAGRNNKMFYVPMAFMMVVTLTSLALTVWAKIGLLAAGTMDAATVLQLVIGVLLMVFAVILAVKGCKTIFGKKRVA